jgi:hypothetical protein
VVALLLLARSPEDKHSKRAGMGACPYILFSSPPGGHTGPSYAVESEFSSIRAAVMPHYGKTLHHTLPFSTRNINSIKMIQLPQRKYLTTRICL